MPLVLNIIAALCYVTGGICMKLSVGLTRPGPGLLVFACFGLGAGLQALAMRKAEMGVSYILVLGMEAALAFLVGALFFREGVSIWKLLGVGLVIAGILLLHAGEK